MQLLSSAMFLAALADGGSVVASASSQTTPPRAIELLAFRLDASLRLMRVPAWSAVRAVASELASQALELRAPAWRIEPARLRVERLRLREVYSEIARLPELDRVGRFAHLDFALPELSTGPEVLRFAPEPPREDYSRAQVITPGWSLWYMPRGERLAVGLATCTRFLLAEASEPIVDPFTAEARLAFFLP